MHLPVHSKGGCNVKVLRAHDVLPEPPLSGEDAYRLLTIGEVARELRCSRGHVQHLIHGKVPHTRPLPSIALGRRRMIRRASLHEWIRATEGLG
jgi:excisionase family DNA binding protein